MEIAKKLIRISIIGLVILTIYIVSMHVSVYAHELSEPQYCYTNKRIEIIGNRDTNEIKAISSENLTFVKTYDDGTWSYVYYNGGVVHGWIHSWDLNNGSGPDNVNVYIKKFKPMGSFKITGYTPSPKENGGSGRTCTGIKASTVVGKCIATDLKIIPLGAEVYIEGIGFRTVMDTGVKGRVVDVLVNNKKEAYALTGKYKVYIVE